mmetsp:Transcript_39923/g.44601  ORF Transcript_39923/g.44601 Transcript_39923/m.44601 type:complete len:86 (-) Transcript_39923:378-635(-)
MEQNRIRRHIVLLIRSNCNTIEIIPLVCVVCGPQQQPSHGHWQQQHPTSHHPQQQQQQPHQEQHSHHQQQQQHQHSPFQNVEGGG